MSSRPRSRRVSPREFGVPASQADAFSSALRARVRLTDVNLALVCVNAPSRIALMRRISKGSRPRRSAQISRWDSVANAVCKAPNERKAPDGVLFYRVWNGKKPMPAFKSDASQEEIWTVLEFVKTLKKD